MENLFSVPGTVRPQGDRERFESFLQGQGGLVVERIISYGHITPEGEWYDQEWDEWVAVLEGEARLSYENGKEVFLGRGDHIFIRRRVRHRVAYTSSPCIWLAIHGDLAQMRDPLSSSAEESAQN